MTNLVITILLGWTGYARFRKGQAGLGVLWLLTGGCFGIGWLIDIIGAVQEYNGGGKPANMSSSNSPFGNDLVFVNPGSKVYHCDQMCAMSRSVKAEEMNEKAARKKGLKPCKKCFGEGYK